MRRKLLVADDSVTIQRVVALSFAGEDVEVETAADGDQALTMVRANKPDVVLADVMMPGLTGYQVCESIKTDPELRQIPVVLLVGTFEPFDQAEASRVQSDGHLTKPFDTEELIQTYRDLIGRSLRRGVSADSDSTAASPESSSPIIAGEVLVSSKTRESFLGDRRILDVLSPQRDAGVPAFESAAGLEVSANAVRIVVEDVVL